MLGTVLGKRYRIITVLGVGGFGKTYLAEDTHHPEQQRCVVKQLKPATEDPRSLEIARRLFNQEVAMLERLGQHDQIPTFIDFFEENNEFYLVQELIEGQSLTDEFAGQKLTEDGAIAVLRDVLCVLEFVHRNQVIHRDIKPANLIRRQRDGKIVLIDFGAVKEINTQLAGGTGQTSFTVGIGTQGYTPSEQLAGKPRFCSDIYALGMTVIQGLIRLQPSQIPEDPDTSEYLWQDYAQISLGLRIFLSRMVRFHPSQRYQSATEALQALDRIAELPTNITEFPASLLMPSSMMGNITQADYFTDIPTSWPKRLRLGGRVMAIATAAVTSLLVGVRYIGWVDFLELAAYDRMMQLRPQAPLDARLLIVEINEADLRALNRPTPSDADVAQVMANLAAHQPRAIGLDLYRDLPQQPGQEALLEQLQADNTIAIRNLGTSEIDQVPPPPGLPADRVGFNDFPIDPDNTVRRNLMFAWVGSESFHSFSLRLALLYLAQDGITPTSSDRPDRAVQIKDTVFIPLASTAGAYHNADAGGYQIMLDYRNRGSVAPMVSFVDVLNGIIDPELVRDRVVLIGTTAPSGKDLFITPFSNGQKDEDQMPGVVVHAQSVSQILSAVLDGRSLFWFWPEWAEILWIAGWAAVGSATAWMVRHPAKLGVSGVVVLLVLSGAGFGLFVQKGWVPVVTPAIAATLAGTGVVVYRTYLLQQRQQVMMGTWISGSVTDTRPPTE